MVAKVRRDEEVGLWHVAMGTIAGGICGYDFEDSFDAITDSHDIPELTAELIYADNYHRKACRLLAIHPQRRLMLSGSADESGLAFNLKTRSRITQLDLEGDVCHLEFVDVASATFAACVNKQGMLYMFKCGGVKWELTYSMRLPERFIRNRRILQAAWRPFAPHVVALRMNDGYCCLFDIDKRSVIFSWKAKSFMTPRGFVWTPSGSAIVTTGAIEFEIRHFKSGTAKALSFPADFGSISNIAVCEDALCVAGNRGHLLIYILGFKGAEIACEEWVQFRTISAAQDSSGRMVHLGFHLSPSGAPLLIGVESDGHLNLWKITNRTLEVGGVFDTRVSPISVAVGLPRLIFVGERATLLEPRISGFEKLMLRRRAEGLKRRRLMPRRHIGADLLKAFRV
eukprot:Gregarina_sp_Poly_1__4802@NODE_255_length_10547_cov_146_368416_g222_i0_p4_GENE_NODE_255_length_10547_cov_146_368416_g222_i0NODE_255_length_10547_cov_146_368416_g222_i0_p4_ORF_typecomplete_len398_score54_72ANAPC4_WD40/PF12894_7/0_22ANAPC4_WD40/PF12894_7/1_9ANAPC4_WD40/PF12894_7/15ANAPC4_WD40/PF12894_7/27Ge1_WD40/PF16529_5/0_0011Ge1_WD40/PF16529_5/19_NODE_255_length_10547_cov_146_368416_g222_i0915810351